MGEEVFTGGLMGGAGDRGGGWLIQHSTIKKWAGPINRYMFLSPHLLKGSTKPNRFALIYTQGQYKRCIKIAPGANVGPGVGLLVGAGTGLDVGESVAGLSVGK